MSVSRGQSNALLKGSYTYEMSGSFFGLGSGNGPFERAGTFVADGNGHITGGSDDFVQGLNPVTTAISGTYAVASDGTGAMVLVVGSTQLEWVFTLTSSSQLTLVEFDSFASGTGGAFLQDPAALGQTPQGAFAFRTQSFQSDYAAQSAVSSVGSMNINGSAIVGNEDVARNGTLGSFTMTGSLIAPDSTGKGSMSLSDSEGVVDTFFYYVIDSSTINMLEIASNSTGEVNFGTGRLRSQTGTPFSNSSLQNQFVLFGTGSGQTSSFGVVSVGVFSSDGNGNITDGSYDSVVNGVALSDSALSGSYTMGSNGRATMTLTGPAAGTATVVAWMVDSSFAFYLSVSSSGTQAGTFNQQDGSPFSNGSLNGQFVFSMYGYDNSTPALVDRVGVASFDGNTSLTLTNYFVNRGGVRSQTSANAATYNVSTNGRVTTSINGVSNNIVMYLISTGNAYLIVEDPNTQVAGGITQQTLQ